jgi:Skp family chaperone for outer membrane proteins
MTMIVTFNSVLVPIAAVLAASACALAAGCAPAASPDAPAIAKVETHRCGSCHAPPEPKTRTRATLEDAFSRHRHRVHLSQDEWQAMLDYLAAPTGSTASQK